MINVEQEGRRSVAIKERTELSEDRGAEMNRSITATTPELEAMKIGSRRRRRQRTRWKLNRMMQE